MDTEDILFKKQNIVAIISRKCKQNKLKIIIVRLDEYEENYERIE